MQAWDELFSSEGIIVAQTLLTRGDLADRQGYLNARNTLLALLERKVVPIINENDVVATEEIKIGDNDNLSALVANLVDADLLILLTDQLGLYTADPRRHSTATLIAEVPRHLPTTSSPWRRGPARSRGTGGMVTKVQAARLATESGVISAWWRAERPKTSLSGPSKAKRSAPDSPQTAHASKAASAGYWRGSRARRPHISTPERCRHWDAGRSLLPAGVVTVNGPFDRGDSVNIVGPEGRPSAAAWRTTARRISIASRDAARPRSRRFSAFTLATRSSIGIMW